MIFPITLTESTPEQFVTQFPDNSIDLLFTYPPKEYVVAAATGRLDAWVAAACPKLKASGAIVIVGDGVTHDLHLARGAHSNCDRPACNTRYFGMYTALLDGTYDEPLDAHVYLSERQRDMLVQVGGRANRPCVGGPEADDWTLTATPIPALPRQLIRALLQDLSFEGDVVVDPFPRTGRIVTEARLMGRHAFSRCGADVLPPRFLEEPECMTLRMR